MFSLPFCLKYSIWPSITAIFSIKLLYFFIVSNSTYWLSHDTPLCNQVLFQKCSSIFWTEFHIILFSENAFLANLDQKQAPSETTCIFVRFETLHKQKWCAWFPKLNWQNNPFNATLFHIIQFGNFCQHHKLISLPSNQKDYFLFAKFNTVFPIL